MTPLKTNSLRLFSSVFRGVTRSPRRTLSKNSSSSVAVAVFVACALLAVMAAVGVGGCGESSGIAEGATVTAYVTQPLCRQAEDELRRAGARAGEVRVRAVCLPGVHSGESLDLATIGASARRATEDSTTVAYLEPPGPGTRFSTPILGEADIAAIHSSSGASAMATLLRAIDGAGDSGSLRESVNDALG